MIKNVKFSGYYFYMNANIYGYFQICISVPLSFFSGMENFKPLLIQIFLAQKDNK